MLERTRAARLYNNSAAYQPVGLLSNQDFVRLRGLLETLGDTHSLAGQKSVSLPVIARYDLPGIDANPMRQLYAPTRLNLVVESSECIPHLNGGPYRPKGVILASHQQAKCGQDLVTGISLHSSTVPFDNRAHFAKIPGEEALKRLRIASEAKA
jgi:hypothetical protein